MHVFTAPQASAIEAARDAGEFFWLDLVDPGDELLRELGTLLGWHPLLVEDLVHRGQRPKVEDFTDHVLVVSYAVGQPPATRDQLRELEHLLVVHGDYVVTVRPDGLHVLDELRDSLARESDGMSEGGVVHRVLDAIVDTTTAAAHDMTEEISGLEDAIDRGANDHVLVRLRAARRYATELYGLVAAQRDALLNLADALEQIPGFDLGLRTHFRDIADHAKRSRDQLDVANRLLDGAFEAYYTMLMAQQGAVTQRLTVIATIFLPLTFVTGFFGQNFRWMVDAVGSRTDFLEFGVGTTVVTALLLAALFKRLHWF
jgi:magnesium transporter